MLRDLVVQLSVIGRRETYRSLKQLKQTLYGGVAQLGEHLPCKQGVKGSIPFISTRPTEVGQTDGRIRAYELESRFVAQVARARA